MTDFHFYLIIGYAVFLVLFITVSSIIQRKQTIEKYGSVENMVREMEDEILEREPIRETFHAKVINMNCFVTSKGYRPPITIRVYTIIFEKDNGEILNISVSEEFYDGFEIGLSGNLELVDGEFYSFEPDN